MIKRAGLESHSRSDSFSVPLVFARLPTTDLPEMTTKRLRGLLTHFGARSPVKETDSPMSASAVVSEPELPTYDKLPMFKNIPGCAWGLWGEDDQLGTVNLLTEKVVQRAAREEILYVECF